MFASASNPQPPAPVESTLSDEMERLLTDLLAAHTSFQLGYATFEEYRKHKDALLTAIAALEAQVPQWQLIETVPHMDSVLIYYVNEYGKGRRIKARFIPRYTCEDASDGDFFEWGPNETGPYMPEGWYEQIDNWDDYAEVFVHKTPSHWMPLPSSPTEP